MKMPWEKELPPGTLVTVGAVECYIQTGKEEIKFDKLWTKTFQTQVICMVWDSAASSLIVGKDDGSLTALKVSADVNYIKYDEYLTVNKHHEKRIMGIHYDPITEYIYTIGEDKKFKVFDLSHNITVSDLSVGNALLSCLAGDRDNKRAFISNRSGQIFIYDISQKNPSLVHTIQAHQKGSIRGLYYDPFKNYLFSANYDDGTIAIIDLQKPGKEKYAAVTAMLHGKKDVRCIVWSHGRYELYSGGEDGTLTFWDASKVSPVYAMKAHTEGICKLQWIENQNVLMTAGKDKKLRFYKLPDEWRDKKMEAEVMKSSKANKQKENLKKFQEYQQKKAEDSDEDDLAGWHK
jgi:WD40 repeat protein